MGKCSSLLFQVSVQGSCDIHFRGISGAELSCRVECRRRYAGEALRVKSCIGRSAYQRYVPSARVRKNEKIEKETPRHDWEGLIAEFEARAASSELPSEPPPPGVILRDENEEEFELLPVVETAACTALTLCMWYLGRIFRLDSFLLLFYPIPMFFVTMRWGPQTGDRVLVSTLIVVLTMMGPLYSILYFFNTGIMALVFSRVLWNRWHWLPSILAGGFAKGVGLAFQFTWMSGIVRYNAWTLIAEQVKILVDTTVGGLFGILKITKVPSFTVRQIQIAVAIVLVLHSVLHVLFTYLASTMILDRVGESIKLKKKPRILRILKMLKESIQRQTRY